MPAILTDNFRVQQVPSTYLAAIAQLVADAREWPLNHTFVRTIAPGLHMRLWRDGGGKWNLELDKAGAN